MRYFRHDNDTAPHTGPSALTEYDVLYVYGTPDYISGCLYTEADVPAAAALAARFPKSYRVGASHLSHGVSDRPRDGVLFFRAVVRADGVNGGVNETGIARYRKFIAAARRMGIRVEFMCMYTNGTPAADLAALAG